MSDPDRRASGTFRGEAHMWLTRAVLIVMAIFLVLTVVTAGHAKKVTGASRWVGRDAAARASRHAPAKLLLGPVSSMSDTAAPQLLPDDVRRIGAGFRPELHNAAVDHFSDVEVADGAARARTNLRHVPRSQAPQPTPRPSDQKPLDIRALPGLPDRA